LRLFTLSVRVAHLSVATQFGYFLFEKYRHCLRASCISPSPLTPEAIACPPPTPCKYSPSGAAMSTPKCTPANSLNWRVQRRLNSTCLPFLPRLPTCALPNQPGLCGRRLISADMRERNNPAFNFHYFCPLARLQLRYTLRWVDGIA